MLQSPTRIGPGKPVLPLLTPGVGLVDGEQVLIATSKPVGHVVQPCASNRGSLRDGTIVWITIQAPLTDRIREQITIKLLPIRSNDFQWLKRLPTPLSKFHVDNLADILHHEHISFLEKKGINRVKPKTREDTPFLRPNDG